MSLQEQEQALLNTIANLVAEGNSIRAKAEGTGRDPIRTTHLREIDSQIDRCWSDIRAVRTNLRRQQQPVISRWTDRAGELLQGQGAD